MVLSNALRPQDIRVDGLSKMSVVASVMVRRNNIIDWRKLDRAVVKVQKREVAGMGIAVADGYVDKERRDECGKILVWLS